MLGSWYNERKNFIEKEIINYLEKKLDFENISCLKDFKEAILYACSGGKKIRAILALEFFLVLKNISFENFLENKNNYKDIILFCIALEVVHAYSLVHDDLPCMDNDTIRRGKPTVWAKFGEWQATLVGDTLNTLAFEIISEIENPILSKKLSKMLSSSVGFSGMIGGQVMDLYFEENFSSLDLETLKKLHNKKTAKLINSAILGGIICSEKEEFIKKFENFGEKFGLAFQIKDDILDIEGEAEKVGKSIGGEEKGFVYFLGLEKSKLELKKLLEDCLEISKDLNSENILELVNYIANREE